MNKTVNATSNTAIETNAQAVAIAKFTPPHYLNWNVSTVTVGELLDMDLAIPTYQRAYVWDEKRAKFFIETLSQGKPVPALILAKLKNSDGEDVYFLIDGLQRYTTINNHVDSVDVNNEYDSDALDELLSNAKIALQIIECDSVEVASELFVRYNNGQALSGVQRNKAQFSEDVQKALIPYIETISGYAIKGKLGKTTPDTAAIMLAACLTDTDNSATSSAAATKILKACEGVADCPTEIIDTYFTAINGEDIDDSHRLYMSSPARFVPAIMAGVAIGGRLDLDTFSGFVANFEALKSDKIKTVVHKKDKERTPLKATETASALFQDTSNAHKATTKRTQAMVQLLLVAHGEAKQAPQAQAIAETAQALNAVLEV